MKDNVTLKTGVMMLKEINYILKYIKIENRIFVLIVIIFHNITFFCILLIK